MFGISWAQRLLELQAYMLIGSEAHGLTETQDCRVIRIIDLLTHQVMRSEADKLLGLQAHRLIS